MVMFFNWVDLWPAVAIISPFSPAGWKSRAGQLKQEGDREDRTQWRRMQPAFQVGTNQGRERHKRMKEREERDKEAGERA